MIRTMAILLVACSAPAMEARVAEDRPLPTIDSHLAETPPLPPVEPCSRPWPEDPDDPRVGFYIAEGGPSEHDDVLVIDRESVTIAFRNLSSMRMCDPEHGSDRDVFPGVRRFERRIDGQRLLARTPCYGWEEVGVFDGDAIVRARARLLRVQPEGVAPCVRDEWLLCQDVFRGQRIALTARDLEELATVGGHWPGVDPRDLPPPRCRVDREGGPRTGVYHRAPDRNLLLDAHWIAMAWDPAARPTASCTYGAEGDLQPGIHRFAARLSGDTLEARLPCEGWRAIGRFTGADLILDGDSVPMRRGAANPYCAWAELSACRPIYEAER